MPITHYVNRAGQQVPIHDFQQLCFVVRQREIAPETIVYDLQRQAWLPAGQTDDYQRALSAGGAASTSSKAPLIVGVVVVALLAFVAAAVAIGAAWYRKNQRDVREAANRALQASDKMAAAMGDKPGETREASALTGSFGMVATGNMGAAMRFVASETEKSQAVAAELVKEHDAIDLSSVLKPESLTSADGIRRSRDLLAAYDRYLTHYETAVKDDRNRIETDSAQLDLSPTLRRAFLDGMHRAQAQTAALNIEFLSVEHRLVATSNEVLDLMSGQLGRVKVSGNALRFRSSADMTRYNDLVERIQQLSRDEQDVSERMAAARQQNRATLEQVVRAAQ